MPPEHAASSLFEGSIADSFADHERTVRGRVRYSLVHRNLEPYVSNQLLKVAGIGGGSGIDTLWLAEQGHKVTLVEPSGDQLEKARKRFSQVSPEIRNRIILIHGDLGSLADKDQDFDLVLAHCVAMYLDEREKFIRDLVGVVSGKGYISLLERNYYRTEADLLQKGDLEGLSRLRSTGLGINKTGKTVYSFKPAELEGLVASAGAKVLEWSGVRTFSENIDQLATELPEGMLEQIIESEFIAGKDESRRGYGKLLHFIARKS